MAVGTRPAGGVHAAVQDHYGALAQNKGACGCSSGAEGESACCQTEAEGPAALGYSLTDLQNVPEEAAEIPLGCGNPVGQASLSLGEVVLDIGSGGGLDAFLAARRVGPQGRVIGVDMTPSMIDRARQAAEKAGLNQVEFRLGQAESLPVEDGSVDVILSNCVINLTKDKGRVFREAYRVLKPGGRLEVSDVVTDGSMPAALQQDAATWAGCVSGALPEREYLDLVSQAGFRDIRAQRSSPGETAGVKVYSLAVSARKGKGQAGVEFIPATPAAQTSCGCGAGSDCCS